MSIKGVVIGAVKSVELLKALSYRSGLGFDGTEQNLFMTLGRFLIFFVVGLVLAFAFPPLNWLIWPLAALAALVVVRLIRG
ncbi:hypothetical protein BL107_09391 [Synechococcus sp. BL107]|jgi:hypothetical protein|uniref:hypothetical protein n=1 Tax=Synechococcus sp. BL107 TaxID=313625 RepID=UPI0000E540BF|nr:hypothetical protein [Synechococcus sp. BL107]EAU70362.1 hypothetical protein BL107_09391 [Synechococcus sp. BL107]|tara:strand:+ start:197 stop:439 length:243 start_codon:yes stop_codon:yes gene_type:complete